MTSQIYLVLTITLCFQPMHSVDAVNLPNEELPIVQFSWENCGDSSDPIQVSKLAVTPSPIKIPGDITLDAAFSINAPLTSDLSLAVKLERKFLGFYVEIPCIDNIGSCTYDFCKDWATACPKYFEKYGLPCNCPFSAQTYSLPNIVVPVTEVPLPAFIVNGNYRITGSLTSAAGTRLACIRIIADLAVV